MARRAGVSPATVSNALNHPERVRPDRLTRIQHAMEELHYVRSEVARHLRSGRSTTIGLLLLDASNPGFTQMAQGVEDAVADGGWTVLTGNSRRDAAREARYLQTYSEQQAAGLIIVPRDGVSSALARIQAHHTPVVLLDRSDADPTRYSVSVDDYHGGRTAAEHLIDLGHRHIAFIGTPEAAEPVRERFLGVCHGVQQASMPVRLEQINAGLTLADGRTVGHQLAAMPDRPTAVIAAIDMVAFGILQSLLELGVRVPQDISLCGYDDTEFAAQLAPPLTSVRRPHYQLGLSAGRMLLTLLDGAEPEERHLRYRPELIVRASTAAPADGITEPTVPR